MAEAEKTKTRDLTDAERTVVAAQKARAESRIRIAELELEAAKDELKTAGHPPVPLYVKPATDWVGEDLDWSDPEAARAQLRASKDEQIKRSEIDVARVNRGLEPIFATK